MAVPRRKIYLYRGFIADLVRLSFQGKLIKGDYIPEFERRFAEYIGVKFAVSASSGTAALESILEALNLEKDSEVILSAYNIASIVDCIKKLGFLPRFADISARSDNLDIEDLKRKVTPKTRAIIATHLFGRPCDIAAITEFARNRNIFVIEDCAHAAGTVVDGKKVGSFGDAAFLSFSLTKPFHALNGGMAITNDEKIFLNVKSREANISDLPQVFLWKNIIMALFFKALTNTFIFTLFIWPALILLVLIKKDVINFYNRNLKQAVSQHARRFRFSNFQALVGLRLLGRLNLMIDERIKRHLKFIDICRREAIVTEDNRQGGQPRWFPYFTVTKHPQRKLIGRQLLFNGIDTGKFLMADCANDSNQYPNTAYAYRFSLQVPVEYCSDSQLERIAGVLKKYLKDGSFIIR